MQRHRHNVKMSKLLVELGHYNRPMQYDTHALDSAHIPHKTLRTALHALGLGRSLAALRAATDDSQRRQT